MVSCDQRTFRRISRFTNLRIGAPSYPTYIRNVVRFLDYGPTSSFIGASEDSRRPRIELEGVVSISLRTGSKDGLRKVECHVCGHAHVWVGLPLPYIIKSKTRNLELES